MPRKVALPMHAILGKVDSGLIISCRVLPARHHILMILRRVFMRMADRAVVPDVNIDGIMTNT
eukprot:1195612-Pyramimonas_sp.AAC.1